VDQTQQLQQQDDQHRNETQSDDATDGIQENAVDSSRSALSTKKKRIVVKKKRIVRKPIPAKSISSAAAAVEPSVAASTSAVSGGRAIVRENLDRMLSNCCSHQQAFGIVGLRKEEKRKKMEMKKMKRENENRIFLFVLFCTLYKNSEIVLFFLVLFSFQFEFEFEFEFFFLSALAFFEIMKSFFCSSKFHFNFSGLCFFLHASPRQHTTIIFRSSSSTFTTLSAAQSSLH